jgi:hypothetical protein
VKVRRLQQLLDDGQWEDHGYTYEREDGRASFRYNTLVWGRIGARYNVQLRESWSKLEDVHTVIPTGDQLRWLEIEEIDGEPEELKATLDEACKIPRPQRVSVVKPAVA